MRSITSGFLALTVLLLSPAVARAQESGPVSKQALHFRLVVGVDPVKEVRGYLDETGGTGTGYDVAVCDLDGDGKPEIPGRRMITMNYGGGRTEEASQPVVQLEIADCDWSIAFDTYWGETVLRPDGGADLPIDWNASADGWFVHFINGLIRVYATPEEAEKATPARIGPPLHWAIESRARGPNAVVTAGLDDENAARFRFGVRGDDDIGATLRIMKGDETATEGLGEYG